MLMDVNGFYRFITKVPHLLFLNLTFIFLSLYRLYVYRLWFFYLNKTSLQTKQYFKYKKNNNLNVMEQMSMTTTHF